MSDNQRLPRIYLIGNIDKPRAPEVFEELAGWLEEQGFLVGSKCDGPPEQVNETEPDFVITLGGDGTILSAARAMAHRQVPVIGVNLGKLGYLADFSVEELKQLLDRLTSEPELISRRMMLDVQVVTSGGKTSEGIALNDCVIRVGEPFRTISLAVEIDGQSVTTVIGDGLIIATPTGSTAHNMSCGGPIVQPDVDAVVLTPKCPHSLTYCPVVLGPAVRLQVTVAEASAGAAVVLDGQFVRKVEGGSRIGVRKSDRVFQLVRHPHRRSWDTLTRKLKWGQNLT